jgi:hypothetical protein
MRSTFPVIDLVNHSASGYCQPDRIIHFHLQISRL